MTNTPPPYQPPPGGFNQPGGGQNPPNQPPSNPSGFNASGLFAGLTDFRFTSFISLKAISLVYVLLMVVVGLAGIGFLVTFLAAGGITAVIGLFLTPVVTLVYFIFIRMSLEGVAIRFRQVELIQQLVDQGRTNSRG